MKVLLSAYACEPGKGSEPRLGWMWVKHLSRHHEVWVITRANNRARIEAELKRNPSVKATFLYYDLPPYLSFWKKGRRGYHLYYYLWQVGIYLKFRRLIKKEKFDVVQHITFGNNWQPSFLSLASENFVWGPVGGENTPWPIFKSLPWRHKIKEGLRETIRFLGQHLDPFVRITACRAQVILETSSPGAHLPYSRRSRRKIVKFPQNAISPEEIPFSWEEIKKAKEGERFVIAYIGEFVPWKGILFVKDALKEFAENAEKDWEAVLAGYGPEYERVKRELSSLGERVKLPGKISMEEVWRILKRAHVFLYPSFHHGQSTILMQAMACGLPVICLEGDATAHTAEDAGVAVKPGPRKKVVREISLALRRLYENRALAREMGERARRLLMEKHLWENRIKSINSLYHKVVQNEGPDST